MVSFSVASPASLCVRVACKFFLQFTDAPVATRQRAACSAQLGLEIGELFRLFHPGTKDPEYFHLVFTLLRASRSLPSGLRTDSDGPILQRPGCSALSVIPPGLHGKTPQGTGPGGWKVCRAKRALGAIAISGGNSPKLGTFVVSTQT